MKKNRAQRERIFSFRNEAIGLGPLKTNAPEMWKLYNTKINKGESMRVFPTPKLDRKIFGSISSVKRLILYRLYFAAKAPCC